MSIKLTMRPGLHEKKNSLVKNDCDGERFYLVISLIPISDKNRVIAGWVRKRDRNFRPTEDLDCSESTGGFVEGKRWEIVEATNLIFHLQFVGVVLSWWNWAVGSINSILVWIFSILYPTPVFVVFWLYIDIVENQYI